MPIHEALSACPGYLRYLLRLSIMSILLEILMIVRVRGLSCSKQIVVPAQGPDHDTAQRKWKPALFEQFRSQREQWLLKRFKNVRNTPSQWVQLGIYRRIAQVLIGLRMLYSKGTRAVGACFPHFPADGRQIQLIVMFNHCVACPGYRPLLTEAHEQVTILESVAAVALVESTDS